MKQTVKETMKQNLQFFKTMWLALNPWRYDEARQLSTKNAFKYFFSFLFMIFVLSILLMLPSLVGFVDKQLDNFETLEVSMNTSMKKAVVFPEKEPYITIDTRKPERELKEGTLLLTEENLHRKMFLGNVKKHALDPYNDLLSNEGIVIAALVLMLPSLLFLFYLGYAIKILILIFAVVLLGFIITRIVKFDVLLKDAIKTGLLAATPMIIIDLIRMPFGFNVYYAQYIAFLLFFIVGIIKIGEFEGTRPGRKHRHKGKYIDLGKKM